MPEQADQAGRKRLWTCRVLSLLVFTLQVWRQIFQVSNTGNWLMWVLSHDDELLITEARLRTPDSG